MHQCTTFNFFRFDVSQISGLCFFVTSTFGNGDAPKMAADFSAWLQEMLSHRDVIISKRVTFSQDFEDSNSSMKSFKKQLTTNEQNVLPGMWPLYWHRKHAFCVLKLDLRVFLLFTLLLEQ